MTMPNKHEPPMNSKLREILKDYALTYAQLLRTPTIEAKNLAEFKCEEAEEAIRKAVAEEMLELTNEQYEQAYNRGEADPVYVELVKLRQKIKEYGGLK